MSMVERRPGDGGEMWHAALDGASGWSGPGRTHLERLPVPASSSLSSLFVHRSEDVLEHGRAREQPEELTGPVRVGGQCR